MNENNYSAHQHHKSHALDQTEANILRRIVFISLKIRVRVRRHRKARGRTKTTFKE